MESDESVFVEHPPSMPILSSSRPLPYPRPDDKQANLNPYQQGARSVVGMTSSTIEQGSLERRLPIIPTEDMKEQTTESGSSRQRQDSDWSLGSDSQSEDMTKHEGNILGVSTAGQVAPFPPPPPPPPPLMECHFSPGRCDSQIPHPVSLILYQKMRA